MKKIALFILSLVMIMSSTVYADELSYQLISSENDTGYSVGDEEIVTWENVIDIAAELTDKNGNVENSVMVLLNKKIISKVPDYTKTPTVSEIAEIFVRVLGYDMYVSNEDYLAYAYDLGLFKGVILNEQEGMNGAEFSEFLMNVLETNIAEISVDIGESSKIVAESENTLLYDRFNIVKNRGIVTATSGTSLTGVSNLSENYIAIDGIKYLKGKVDADRFLGQNVEFYVKEDEDGDAGTLIYMTAGKKNSVVEILSGDIVNFDGSMYEYEIEESSKNKTVKIAEDASFIYNGFAAGRNSLKDEEIAPKSGLVRAIDNDDDNFYDVFIIYDVKPVILRKADAKYEKLYFDYEHTYNGSAILSLDEKSFSGEYKIYDSEMNEILFEDLQARSVLSIGQAKNGDYIIISSVYKGIGGITALEKEDKKIVGISVSDAEYAVSPYYERGSTDTLQSGLFGTFYFDFAYQLVGFVKENNSENIGYLVKGYYDDENEGKGILKIFNINGMFERLEMAEKVTVYSAENMKGKKLEAEAAVNLLDNQTLIAYTVANNKVTKIYKTVTDENFQYTNEYPVLLNKTVPNNGNKIQGSRLYQGLMAGKYRVPKTTVIFSIPVDKAKEDKYSIYYGSKFPANGDYYFRDTVSFYNIDDYMKINIILEEKTNTSATVSDTADMYVVEKVTNYIDEDDMVGVQINCYGEGEEKLLYTSDLEMVSSSDVWGKDVKIDQLKRGDVIQVSANEEGELTGFRLLFEAENPGEYRSLDGSGKSITPSVNSFILCYGIVKGVDSNAIIQNCTGDGTDKTQNVVQLTNNISNYPTSFYQYDVNTKKVSVITLDDIEVGDEVMIRRTYTSVNLVYKIVK